MKNKEQHDIAWKLLEDKGLSLGERVTVRSSFASAYKDEIPHIEIEYEKGNVKYYRSSHEPIRFMVFETEEEVYLANAMFKILGDNFNVNEFMHQYTMILRILQVKSKWA